MKRFFTALVLCSAMLLALSVSASIRVVSAEDCVIPSSGPWPPCATGGGGAASTGGNQGSGNDCVIPNSGPWPPCATSGGATGSPAPGGNQGGGGSSNSGDCVIPSSGPWPPCATSSGGASSGNAAPGSSADDDCVIPSSGPWPPCASSGGGRPAPAQPTNPSSTNSRQRAQVTRIVDGDTIVVNLNGGAYSVQLIGIDAPEPGGACSAESTAHLSGKIAGQWIEMEKDVSETDQFSRLLRYIYLNDRLINGEMINEGYATAVRYPPDTQHHDQFAAMEADARANQRGCLWKAAPPAPDSASSTGQVIIERVHYDGAEPYKEGDEYAVIKNVGSTPVNLNGWRLNAGDNGQDFRFPDHVLEPGASCRVYTDEIHPETCGFSFGRNSAIWNNKGDCGLLYDASGALVDEYCY